MDILQTVAGVVKDAFPELAGRVMIVSEAQINRERVPRLPACLIALLNERPNGKSAVNTASQNELVESFVVDFWLPPKAYDENGSPIDAATIGEQPSATVYYAYYPYDEVRDTLLTAMQNMQSEQRGRVYYEKLEIDADKFAVTLSFSFSHRWFWCPRPSGAAPPPGRILFRVTPETLK